MQSLRVARVKLFLLVKKKSELKVFLLFVKAITKILYRLRLLQMRRKHSLLTELKQLMLVQHPLMRNSQFFRQSLTRLKQSFPPLQVTEKVFVKREKSLLQMRRRLIFLLQLPKRKLRQRKKKLKDFRTEAQAIKISFLSLTARLKKSISAMRKSKSELKSLMVRQRD